MEGFEKKNNIYKIIVLVVITAFITFMATFLVVKDYYTNNRTGIAEAIENNNEKAIEAINNNEIKITEGTANLDTKIEVLKLLLEKDYLGEINEDKMIESALKGYIEGLGDDYTEYLSNEEYKQLMIDVEGNYVGIGVYMAKDKNDNVIVLMPIEGSPAEEAGLQTGDIITKVNGENCNELELDIVASKVKGEEGTTVELEILRETETFTKTIERRNVIIKDMNSEILNNNIGYIEILSFNDGLAKEFKEKLLEFKEKGIKSLIIDVRDNGGGVVSETIEIADMLTKKGATLMVAIDKGGNKEFSKSKEDSLVEGMKVVILANENSASASEILVGALQDNEVAKFIGTTTFGKGVMQEIRPLSIGGALKITIQEFRTPKENVINKKGLEPDILVEEVEDKTIDAPLNRALELCK